MVKPFEYLGKLFVFSLILILLYIKRKVKFQLFESFDNNTGELYNNEKVSLIMNKECINHLKYYFEIKFDKYWILDRNKRQDPVFSSNYCLRVLKYANEKRIG